MIRFVTSNDGKFKEVSALLATKGIEVGHIDTTYPEIQADSLEEVVRFGLASLPSEEGDVFIEDSGLFIDSLRGFPGVFSSYVFRTIGCEGVLKVMLGWKDREARFESCVGLRLGGNIHIFKGKCKGAIAVEMRGKGGFGYDPIFIPKGERRTFAQMSLDEKNALSHRGKAARSLLKFLIDATKD